MIYTILIPIISNYVNKQKAQNTDLTVFWALSFLNIYTRFIHC